MPNNILIFFKNACKICFLSWLSNFLRICILLIKKKLIYVDNDPKNFLFCANEYQKCAEFYADFKSVEINGKMCTQKMLFAKNVYMLVVQKRTQTPILHPFFL